MIRLVGLLLLCTARHALSIRPGLGAGSRAHSVHRVRSGHRVCAQEGGLSWQEELENVLSLETAQSDREVLVKDLLSRSSEIVGDVAEAFRSGSLGGLVPPTSKSGKLISDFETVQRQVTEDLLPQALKPQILQDAAADAASAAQEASERGPAAVAAVLQDPAKALELVQQEAVNTFSRTPTGLETPPYTPLRSGDGYEVREYPSYGVARVQMGEESATSALAGSRSFRALAAFVFGSNAQSESIGMTTPVRTDVDQLSSSMSFVLPSKYSAATAPAPSDPAVRLQQVEGQTLAVAEFTGFATGGEVERQREQLLAKLRRDGVDIPDGGSSYTVFQYNPPYTIPWLRRNELAMSVSLAPPTTEETEPLTYLADDIAEPEISDEQPPPAAATQVIDAATAVVDAATAQQVVDDDSAPSDIED
eukprot:CAMPEP_0119364706 /NCGR_PEP_ID=MMETSP1334-20130426/11623_1 /TAXON_ID=127549 /ORGANISM="Calcidiscus leptoporus, Strain RCC1130" /LENGTH=420 /DNA_ID=CAMNT_0007380481 /DNA_START=20 /DNA_END=1282 /DNA_ORIENTATION=-